MDQLMSIGDVNWTREELTASLEEFAKLYPARPIRDNTGGMKAPHMFSTWFALRRLQPKVVVESGVWHGQGTWLIEQACPQAEIVCIEIAPKWIQYRSQRARYFDRDFATHDWNGLPKDETVLFFDDHQNAYERLKVVRWFGFRHAFFEDNYPASQGDCYSLKKAFLGVGFDPPPPQLSPVNRIKRTVRGLLGVQEGTTGAVPPNTLDAAYLRANLAVYYEFPPVFQLPQTRWGDPWSNDHYPTPPPLLKRVEVPFQQLYFDEAGDYTWICYVRMK
jgi:hypothetical protein